MKLTKSHLKQLIKEEVRKGFGQGVPAKDNFSRKREIYLEAEEDTLATGAKQIKSAGSFLANKLASIPGLDRFWTKLATQDDFQKAQFLALVAEKIGLDIRTAAAKLTASQTKLQKTASKAQPAPEEPEEL